MPRMEVSLNKETIARAKGFMGKVTWRSGDYTKGRKPLEKALRIFEKYGADQDKAWAVKMLKEIRPP